MFVARRLTSSNYVCLLGHSLGFTCGYMRVDMCRTTISSARPFFMALETLGEAIGLSNIERCPATLNALRKDVVSGYVIPGGIEIEDLVLVTIELAGPRNFFSDLCVHCKIPHATTPETEHELLRVWVSLCGGIDQLD